MLLNLTLFDLYTTDFYNISESNYYTTVDLVSLNLNLNIDLSPWTFNTNKKSPCVFYKNIVSLSVLYKNILNEWLFCIKYLNSLINFKLKSIQLYTIKTFILKLNKIYLPSKLWLYYILLIDNNFIVFQCKLVALKVQQNIIYKHDFKRYIYYT